MAALNIAFEAPDNFRSHNPIHTRPIDLVHLAKQTMGDKNLEIEALQIFARQARACLAELAEADAEKARTVAHRLKGAAAAVGAHEVEAAASRLETEEFDAGLVANAGKAIITAENFILKLCR